MSTAAVKVFEALCFAGSTKVQAQLQPAPHGPGQAAAAELGDPQLPGSFPQHRQQPALQYGAHRFFWGPGGAHS